MPTLTGSCETAKAQLAAVGLKGKCENKQSTPAKKDQVIGSDPAFGSSADKGSTVRIFIGAGPNTVAVPDVSGKFVSEATGILTSKGLEATVVAPANVKVPDNPNMPNLGNPMSARVTGPASNGSGTGGGIGSGSSNGIGSGTGPGHGPGQGGGFGGGTYKLGDIGVTAPVAKFTLSRISLKKPAKQSIRARWFWPRWLVRMDARATSGSSAAWAWAWMKKLLSG